MQRRRLEEGFDSDDDGPEVDEEQPQVVVLGSGDLTAAEAEEEKMRIERGIHIRRRQKSCVPFSKSNFTTNASYSFRDQRETCRSQ